MPAREGKLVFFDSTDLHWCPDVGFEYAAKGEQVKVDSPGLANPWHALFGSLCYPSGEGVYTIHERKRHNEVKAHLECLLETEKEGFFFVVLDNASAHTTPQLAPFLEENKERLELVFQPSYSPHLNLIERLWRVLRRQVTKNQFYRDLLSLSEAAIEWLGKLPFEKYCSIVGICEKNGCFVYKTK